MASRDRRIAIIVQRAGEDIVGGSEGYALSMARALSATFKVDIISTTARDHVSWKNEYPKGTVHLTDHLNIIRFPVSFERGSYWFELDRVVTQQITLDVYETMPLEERESFIENKRRLPLGLGDIWLKYEGPYAPDLLTYLSENEKKYDYFIFMTYLYPTTYFGIDCISDKEKIYFVPTYHDEVSAYLPNFTKYKKYKHLFLTNAEKYIAENNIYRTRVDSDIIGFGIKDRFDELAHDVKLSGETYVLYAGRIEAAKGVQKMFKMFEQYSSGNGDLKLYLIGDGILKNHQHKNIVYKGFVSEEEKLRLMKNAIAFIHPSAFESLGIVLLESFMMGTPALVNKKSVVLHEHIINSKAGYSYDNYDEFCKALHKLTYDRKNDEALRNNARDYFLLNYSMDAYKNRLLKIFA